MKSILSKIQSFLVEHSVWTHFTCILIVSYVFMQLSQLIGPSIFMTWVAALSFFSLPVFVFVIVRTFGTVRSSKLYWLFWGLLFLSYPLILFGLQIDVDALGLQNIINIDIDGSYSYTFLSMLFIFVEGIHFYTEGQRDSKSISTKWFQRLSPFKLTMLVTALLCLIAIFASSYFQELQRNKGLGAKFIFFLYHYSQLFIVYASYYIYFYIHHKILYKIILKKRGLFHYFIGLALVIMLIIPIHNYWISFFPFVHTLYLHPIGLVPNLMNDFNYSIGIAILLFSFPVIVIVEWYKQANTLAELEKEKSKTELSLLRQQINPHFFFNTLNNLYAMSLNEEEDTPETILQLSELMRYVIYKGKEEKVHIKEEIKYMNDYIDLQMMRVHKDVDLKIDFKVQNKNLEIPPLLFIILLENAFKHGIEIAAKSSKLHVSLQEIEGYIIFTCLNSKEDSNYQNPPGIGLENLRKRLDILYPEAHQLSLENEETFYKATLKIKL